MQARKLRKILNDTNYTLSNSKEYICIGSYHCSDLISVNKSTLIVKYALDTFREGRKSLKYEELTFIWDKLHELIENGEIHEIINGKDIIENPLPVYTIRNKELIESITDEYGYPNTDDDGYILTGSSFATKKEALEYGIRECEMSLNWVDEFIKRKEEELFEARNRAIEIDNQLMDFNILLSENPDKLWEEYIL